MPPSQQATTSNNKQQHYCSVIILHICARCLHIDKIEKSYRVTDKMSGNPRSTQPTPHHTWASELVFERCRNKGTCNNITTSKRGDHGCLHTFAEKRNNKRTHHNKQVGLSSVECWLLLASGYMYSIDWSRCLKLGARCLSLFLEGWRWFVSWLFSCYIYWDWVGETVDCDPR